MDDKNYRLGWKISVILALVAVASVGIAEDKNPGWVVKYKDLLSIMIGFCAAMATASIGFHSIRRQTFDNAEQSRRRDDRLRLIEARTLAAALSAEITGVYTIFFAFFQVEIPQTRAEICVRISIADVPKFPVLQANLDKIGMLSTNQNTMEFDANYLAYDLISIMDNVEGFEATRTYFNDITSIDRMADPQSYVQTVLTTMDNIRRKAWNISDRLDDFAAGRAIRERSGHLAPKGWWPEGWPR